MKRVCLIAYDFPPLNSGGAQRPLRFAKFLEEERYETIVFSISNYESKDVVDEGFGSQIPNGLQVERTALRGRLLWEHPKIRFYLSPEDDLGARWRSSLFERLRKVWKESPCDAILVTAPPFSILRLAAEAKREFGVPLIIDLRDPWSSCVISPFPSKWHYQRLLRTEADILATAAEILVATPGMQRDIARLHPQVQTKISVLPNGFGQPADYLKPILDPPHEQVTIGYVGKFYFNSLSHSLIFAPWYLKKPYQMLQYSPRKEDWSYRSPLYFFRAIAILLQRAPSWRQRLRIRITDNQPESIRAMVRALNLDEVVDFVGFVPKLELPRFYSDCQYLLMTSAKVSDGGDYCIAGKSCEYISMQRPILAFVCPGDQNDFMTSCGVAQIFDPDCPEENAEKLDTLFNERREFSANKAYLERFEPKACKGTLTTALRRACERQ